jgi:hypothetical protein
LGGAAEFAVLRLPRRVKDRDGVAALALDEALFRLPAAGVIADAAQRGDEIVLDDRAARIELRRRFGPAERADELCFAGFQIASPPHDGHANFDSATASPRPIPPRFSG